MTGWAALLAAALLVALSAAALTALLRPAGRVEAAVTAGMLALAVPTVVVLVTGVAGVLRPGPVLAGHALVALGAAVALGRWPRPGRLLPGWAAVRAAPWETAAVLLAAAALAWQLLVALVLPPYAYDALTYHLTAVAGWVRSGSLEPSPLSLCCAYYPSNADLLPTWTAVLLGRDALVGAVQVASAVLCGLAAAGLGRLAGLRRAGAAAAGALVVLTPALLAQAPTPYVDVTLTGLELAGLYGVARLAQDPRAVRLVLPAVCAGLLAGTKGTGLLWAAVLVGAAVVAAGAHVRRGRLSARAAVAGSAVLVAACAVLGGWWYVRSARDTGNPLYPIQVDLAGRTVFAGPGRLADVLTAPDQGAGRPWPVAVARSWAADVLPWRHGSYDYQQRSGGFGPLWTWLGVWLLPVALVGLWRRRSAALWAAVPVLGLLLVQPYRWWARFTLPLAVLGVLAVLLAVQRLRPGVLRLGLRAAAAVCVLAGTALTLVEVDPASRAPGLPAAEVLRLAGAPEHERGLGRLFLPEYRFLEQVPQDATVVVDLEAEPVRFVYPLFGRALSRTVLASGSGPVPDDAWVVTATGRELDAQLAATRPGPVADVRDVRVWAPRQ